MLFRSGPGGAFPFLRQHVMPDLRIVSDGAGCGVPPGRKTAGNGSQAAGAFALAWDLFLFEATVSEYRSDSVRFLHLFKFGLVVLGGQPPRAGGNREIPSCFFMRVGEDGATHQCNEDIGLMREIPGMVIINPSDDVEAKAAVRAAYEYVGPVYLRFGRLDRKSVV